MTIEFLEDAESTHMYNGQMFVVDFYPHPTGGIWQCCDSRLWTKATGTTKQEAIDLCHKEWNEYMIEINGGNK